MNDQANIATLDSHEIEAVNGAGRSGFVAGFLTAKSLGASDKTAATVGNVVSFIQDHIS
jgi:hypothetical protein